LTDRPLNLKLEQLFHQGQGPALGYSCGLSLL